MAWMLTGNVETYLAGAGELLQSRAAENTIILAAIATIRAQGMSAFGDTPPLFGWWGDPASAAFMHTPPYGVALTTMDPEKAADLAAVLAARGRFPAGANAEPKTAAAFAAEWEARTGQSSQVSLSSRMYRLGRLRPPAAAPSGRPRLAGHGDRNLLIGWLDAFHQEATPGEPPASERVVNDRLSYGGLTLWETGGIPVSLAGQLRPAFGHVRVGPVYTPPRWRGKGFAGAVTAAVCRAALDAGVGEVLLFTDLANPTSNALYQRLGFDPVTDRVVLTFHPRS